MDSTVLKKFIVFEGVDGAGTSTQTKLLTRAIPGSSPTFEPTGSTIGRMIRGVLKKESTLDRLALAYLFSADRAEHLYGNGGIISECKDKIVICDRYLFSSLAYQSLDIPFDEILKLNENFPMPQVVFFINTPLDECEKRIGTRGAEREIFENRTMQEKILKNYLRAFDVYKKKDLNIFELDGMKRPEALLEEELEILKRERII